MRPQDNYKVLVTDYVWPSTEPERKVLSEIGATIIEAPDQEEDTLIALASDFTNYPEDYSDTRRAELLEAWMDRWVQPDDVKRLNARIRKRRQRLKENANE